MPARALVVPARGRVGTHAPLVSALERAGARVRVLDDAPLPAALGALADEVGAGGRTVVVADDVVAATASLARLVDDPSTRTCLLVSPDRAALVGVRLSHHVVVSAGSEHHDVSGPTRGSLGAFAVREEDSADAAAALRAMADVARQQAWDGDAVDHAVVALVRGDVAVLAVEAVGPCLRSPDPGARAEVIARLAAGEDARALRASGDRDDDGFYSTFVLRRLSKPVTDLAIRLGLRPNAVTLLSLAVGLGAAVLFAAGQRGATVAAALLLQVSLVLDCVDGEVARRTRRFSALGAWLDASTDRVKEYAVYAGLAVGAARGGEDIWLLAGAVLVLQTVRHMADYDFGRVLERREAWAAPRDLAERSDGGVASEGTALDLSRRADRRGWVRWAKKAVHLPIGERWLVISAVSVLAGGRAALVALLVLGLVAVAYTAVGRLLRIRRWRHTVARSGRELLAPQLDLGPLAWPVWRRLDARRPRLTGPLGWAVPAALRLLELGLVLAATAIVAPGSAAWAFGLLFVLAYHHYDTLYRALGGQWPPRWLVVGGLGVEGRILVVLAGALLGPAALSAVLVAGTVLLAAWFVAVASAQYVAAIPERSTGSES